MIYIYIFIGFIFFSCSEIRENNNENSKYNHNADKWNNKGVEIQRKILEGQYHKDKIDTAIYFFNKSIKADSNFMIAWGNLINAYEYKASFPNEHPEKILNKLVQIYEIKMNLIKDNKIKPFYLFEQSIIYIKLDEIDKAKSNFEYIFELLNNEEFLTIEENILLIQVSCIIDEHEFAQHIYMRNKSKIKKMNQPFIDMWVDNDVFNCTKLNEYFLDKTF